MERRLAAILATDVVGYSRLIRADEEGTLAALNALRADIIDPKLAEHNGRIVKLMGDGMLAEFPSVVDAVRVAVESQQALAEHNAGLPEDKRIEFRVGINLGDVVIDGDDIQGDGVNIAARLEGLAEAGGICISGSVYEQVRDRMDFKFEDLGEQEVKNIARPVRVWQWLPAVSAATATTATDAPPPLPDKPSIAVLPFDNMSDDPGQEFFADGIAEDVITALSRFRSLFVIARNSSFSYKGQAVDIKQLASDLGVRYVVEGSVRKAGNKVRITAQLIDAASGNHLWADRFDGTLDDVFDLQDQITEQIVVAVEPEIGVHERERVWRKPPESLDAWELLQRGLSHMYRANDTDRTEAIRIFREVVALDPGFAAAHAYLAYALWHSSRYGDDEDAANTATLARGEAEQAVSLNPNEPVAHFVLGRMHITVGEFEMALGDMQTAISVNPNSAWGHFGIGLAYLLGARQAEQALPHFDTALRLSPRDPMRWRPLMVKGNALRSLGRYDEAIAFGRQACQVPGIGYLPHLHLAVTLSEAGHDEAARSAVAEAAQLHPALSIDFIRNRFAEMRETTLNSILESVRKAGLPEE